MQSEEDAPDGPVLQARGMAVRIMEVMIDWLNDRSLSDAVAVKFVKFVSW